MRYMRRMRTHDLVIETKLKCLAVREGSSCSAAQAHAVALQEWFLAFTMFSCRLLFLIEPLLCSLRANVDLRHDFCAKLNDAQADPLADPLADRRAADEDVATDGPQPLPDCRCLPHHSDFAVTVDCGQGEMDMQSVASASENMRKRLYQTSMVQSLGRTCWQRWICIRRPCRNCRCFDKLTVTNLVLASFVFLKPSCKHIALFPIQQQIWIV